MEEWLVQTVMTMYERERTVVRTKQGYSTEFELKVGVHRGSVLSPLLFVAVMEVMMVPGRASGHKTLLQPQSLARKVREGVRLGSASRGQGENCEFMLLACGGYRWKGLFHRPAAR